jgi:hypothetical protein
MPRQLYRTITLKLSKDFLKKAHSHPLISEIPDINEKQYSKMWRRTKKIVKFNFGGRQGTQFTSKEQMESFKKAFNTLLTEKRIDLKHADSLLYLILFIDKESESQSLANNQYNRLMDYADFVINLFTIGIKHVEDMSKKKDYGLCFDEATREFFFAKTSLIDSLGDDLVDYVPNPKNANEIVRYLRVDVCGHELYIPEELSLAINNVKPFKSVFGEQVHGLTLPAQFKHQFFKEMLASMMNEHKQANTDFYKLFEAPKIDVNEFKKFYKASRKYKFKNAEALIKVGTVVSDYILSHNLLKNKVQIAEFLWEYFSLFKAYQLPKKSIFPIPDNYCELTWFYLQNKITKDSVRLMMKNTSQIGDF